MNKKLLGLAIIGLIFLQINYTQPVSADSLNEIKVQQDRTEQEIQTLQEDVNATVEEANTINETLGALNESIDEKENDIKKTETNISEQEEVVSERMDQARERLKSLQVNETSQNVVLALLKSESIADMFNRIVVISRLTDASNEQIEVAEEEVQKLADLKEELVNSRQDLEKEQDEALAQKNELDHKVASLQEMIQENQVQLSALSKKESEENARIKKENEEVSISSSSTSNASETKQESTTNQQSTKKQESKKQSTKQPNKSSSTVKETTEKESKPAKTTGRTLQVQATGYSTQQPGLSTHTRMGIDLRVNPRVIAVDPSVIPLGSMVEVEGKGVYIAGDTGGAINGNIIDIHFSTVAEALQWGRRNITVRILD
ncbi:MAG: 3D domain-containing protein [Alkalibacterium gilvum]